jgi:maleylacetoacetate isomerase
MKLYTYFRSSAAFRVRIALNLKNITYEPVPVHLRRNEQRDRPYAELNAQKLVPALEDANQVITQSLAIIEYLEEKVPRPALLPGEAGARALVRSMALLVACDIHPLNNLRVLNYLRSPLGCEPAEVDTWYRHWVYEGFAALESQVRRFTGDGRHSFGRELTLADVCLVPQMYNARRLQCDLTAYPTLRAVSSHLESLSAFARAAPEAQPDAEL